MKTIQEILDLATQNGYAEYVELELSSTKQHEVEVTETDKLRVESLWIGVGNNMKEFKIYSFKKNIELIKKFFDGKITEEGFLEFSTNESLNTFLLFNVFRAIEEKNIFQVKRSPKGNVYLRNIFPEADGIFFDTPTRVSIPGITYFDDKNIVSAKRDTILMTESPCGLRPWECPSLEDGEIISIKANQFFYYLDRITYHPDLDISVYPYNDFGLEDWQELMKILKKIAKSYPEPTLVENIDEIFENYKEKEYREFEEIYSEEFSKTSVVGVSGFYTNRYPINQEKFSKVGMYVSDGRKGKVFLHVLVQKPEDNTIICPKKYMGIVIGKAGVNIKMLEKKWGKKLKILEHEDEI